MAMTAMQQELREIRRPGKSKPTFTEVGARLIAANPQADAEELVKPYAKELRKSTSALESLCLFALEHIKARFFPTHTDRRSLRATGEGVKLQKERARRVKATAKEVLKLMLHQTPLGKALCDCTGKELWKLGGFYRVLSEMAGGRNSKATLRDKDVTEETLQKTLRRR